MMLSWQWISSLKHSGVNVHAPLKRIRIKDRETPLFTPELSTQFKLSNAAWALATTSGDSTLWLTIRQARNKCTAAVKKSTYYLNLIITSSSNPAKFWKSVNSIKKN